MKFCQMTRLSAAVLAVMLLLTACTGKSGGKETEAYTDGASEPITETNDTDLPATATPETKPDDPDDVTQPDESAAGTLPSEQDTEPETEPVPAPTGLFDDPTHLSGFLQETNQPFLSASGCGIAYNADGSVTLTGTWKKGAAIAPALTVSYARMMQTCWDGFTETGALPNGGDDRYYAASGFFGAARHTLSGSMSQPLAASSSSGAYRPRLLRISSTFMGATGLTPTPTHESSLQSPST